MIADFSDVCVSRFLHRGSVGFTNFVLEWFSKLGVLFQVPLYYRFAA